MNADTCATIAIMPFVVAMLVLVAQIMFLAVERIIEYMDKKPRKK